MTAVKAAKELGFYVISCDYLPNNPAHKYADEYHNVSTTDKEAVLSLAIELSIDGIASYASDVSATTVAYISEHLGLPGNPLKSVEILTNKHLFRKFLKENGFFSPENSFFYELEPALRFYKNLKRNVIVKPVDSCGSKGVTKVDINDVDAFVSAYNVAMNYSISKTIIVEEFINRIGYQIDSDGFVLNGNIVTFTPMDQHKDISCSKYTPIGHSVPSIQDKEIILKTKNILQNIFDLLKMKIGAFNFEYTVDELGRIFIIEIGPRNGGNLITDTIKLGTGVDLAKYTILAALGEDCTSLEEKNADRFVSSYIVHSLKKGVYKEIIISDEIKSCIRLFDMFIKQGDKVEKFNNANFAIGAMLLEFDSVGDMLYKIDNMNDFIEVVVE